MATHTCVRKQTYTRILQCSPIVVCFHQAFTTLNILNNTFFWKDAYISSFCLVLYNLTLSLGDLTKFMLAAAFFFSNLHPNMLPCIILRSNKML